MDGTGPTIYEYLARQPVIPGQVSFVELFDYDNDEIFTEIATVESSDMLNWFNRWLQKLKRNYSWHLELNGNGDGIWGYSAHGSHYDRIILFWWGDVDKDIVEDIRQEIEESEETCEQHG